MSQSLMVLRAVVWSLLAGLCLELFTLALPLEAPDYSRSSLSWNKGYRHSLNSSLVVRAPQILTASDLGKRDAIGLDHQRYEDTYQKMDECYQGLLSGSLELSRLSDNLFGLENALIDGLKLYQSNLLCIRTNLEYLGRERGLANYDRNSDLETLIKKVINVHKGALSYLDTLVYRIPGIGPVLGPIVYDIKCVLDKLLDAVENIGDAVINTLRPLLELCSQDTLKVACKSGISLLGICI